MTTACISNMENYLLKVHGDEITRILKSTKPIRRIIQINLTTLQEIDNVLFKLFCTKYDEEHEKWKKALKNVVDEIILQEALLLTETQSMVDIEYFQHPDENCWPGIEKDHLWKVVEFRGYVYRVTSATKMEYMREVFCKNCKKSTLMKGDRIFNFAFTAPKKCTLTPLCTGNMFFKSNKYNDEDRIPEHTMDFQEFKVQEIAKSTPKNRFLIVQAENHLVNLCTIGDTVRILGILEFRMNDHDTTIKKFVVRAINIKKESLEMKLILEPEEITRLINDWNEDRKRHGNNEIKARDEMLLSVAPDLIDCFGLKLALLIILCSGGGKTDRPNHFSQYETKDREVCHLLIAGVPGIGKSQLMKSALSISARSIKTVGTGSTKAGLTASYYKEKGETHIEAGALVLANNGICCIDEFNLMPTAVRESLHEVMEQQKFMLCKAAVKTEVHAKCSVIAAMNHKLKFIPKEARTDSENELREINMEASLASRFDLIFMLDHPGGDYDNKLLNYIVDNIFKTREEIIKSKTNTWNLKRLQLHVICAKGIDVEISDEVHAIIVRYFEFTQSCERVNMSRNTIRLKNSLQRLTIAHAKLLLRKKTKIIDIMTIIWLMENSWTFGNLIEPINLVTSELPVGPSSECIEYILHTLGLQKLIEVYWHEEDLDLNNPLRKIDSNKLYGNKNNNSDTMLNEKIEIPQKLQKTFAISSIDDLFEDDCESDVKETQESAFNSFPSFCSFAQPIAKTSTQIEPPKLDFKKPPAKRSTSSSNNNDEVTKKQKVCGDDIEESLGMINALLGIENDEIQLKEDNIAEKFAKAIGSDKTIRNSKELSEQNETKNHFVEILNENINISTEKATDNLPKSDGTNIVDRLKRFNYESQGVSNNDVELSLSEDLIHLSNQLNGQNEKLNELENQLLEFNDDIDADNFDPYS